MGQACIFLLLFIIEFYANFKNMCFKIHLNFQQRPGITWFISSLRHDAFQVGAQ